MTIRLEKAVRSPILMKISRRYRRMPGAGLGPPDARELEAKDSVTKRAEDQIAEMTRQGLTLTRPFYLLLEDYEKSDKRFDVIR